MIAIISLILATFVVAAILGRSAHKKIHANDECPPIQGIGPFNLVWRGRENLKPKPTHGIVSRFNYWWF
jgi:hypothetical protein